MDERLGSQNLYISSDRFECLVPTLVPRLVLLFWEIVEPLKNEV